MTIKLSTIINSPSSDKSKLDYFFIYLPKQNNNSDSKLKLKLTKIKVII